MMIEEIKKLYEDMKLNIKIRNGLKEGKIRKYDNSLLESMKDYDYYNLPMVVGLLNRDFKGIDLRNISLEFVKFLMPRGNINLLESRNQDYYLIELTIGNKKYIYDVLTKLVYDETYYYEINADIKRVRVVFDEEIISEWQKNEYLMVVASSTPVRANLVESVLEDYKNGYSSTIKTKIALNDYVEDVVNKQVLSIVKNNH